MFETLKTILSEIKQDPELVSTITEATDIINGIGLDSLQMISFVLRLEDEFNIEINFDEFDLVHLNSVKALCEFLEKTSQVA